MNGDVCYKTPLPVSWELEDTFFGKIALCACTVSELCKDNMSTHEASLGGLRSRHKFSY